MNRLSKHRKVIFNEIITKFANGLFNNHVLPNIMAYDLIQSSFPELSIPDISFELNSKFNRVVFEMKSTILN